MEKLRIALENVSDSYEDFVIGLLAIASEYDMAEQIISYLRYYPNAETSDIIGYVFSEEIENADQSPSAGRRMTAAML